MDTNDVQASLTAAAEALNNKKFELAASLANSVIEHDLNNYRAWELRAAAAAGGATVADSRMEEAVNAWMTALHLVPPELADALRNRVVEGFTRLLFTETKRRADDFSVSPTADAMNKLIDTLSDGLRLQNLLTVQGDLSFDRGEQYTKIARTLSEAAAAGFESAKKSFGPSHSNMQQWQWEKYTDEGDSCLLLLETAVNYCRDSDLGKNICDLYIRFGETLKESCSWKYTDNAGSADAFERDQTFTAGAKHIREDDIRRLRTIRGYFEANQINRLCRELATARTEEDEERGKYRYWRTHAEEKTALETENDDLLNTIAQTEYTLENLPITFMLAQTRNEISQYQSELQSLKFGARKRKKELKKQIDVLSVTEKTQQEEETQTRNALIWTQKKSRARIAEIKRIFAAKQGRLPAPPGTFCINKKNEGLDISITAQTLFDHLCRVLPSPYLVSGLTNAKRADHPLSPVFSSLGTVWEIPLKKTISDTAEPVSEPQLFIAAKTKETSFSAVILRCSAAHTADEEALRNFGRIGSYLLLSLLQTPDQPKAERMILSIRHGNESTLINTEGFRIEYLFTEEEQTDGSVKKTEYILIRSNHQL